MKPFLVLLFGFICVFNTRSNAQQVIGLPKDEVIRVIREEYKDFAPDNSSRNTTFKYLKYIDRINEQTLLCMLSEKDICTSVKLISDYMNLEDCVAELNKKYRKLSGNSWSYVFNKQTLIVTLKKEEWFFSVLTKPEKK
jgi:hypothetical protein